MASGQPAVEPKPQEGQPVADALVAIAAQLTQLIASSAAVNGKVTALAGEVAATQAATLASASAFEQQLKGITARLTVVEAWPGQSATHSE
eukprot:SAG11_NODE_6389_length_1323_cov_1.309641_2_plen_91_part_00